MSDSTNTIQQNSDISSSSSPCYSSTNFHLSHMEVTACEEYEIVQNIFFKIIKDYKHQKDLFTIANQSQTMDENVNTNANVASGSQIQPVASSANLAANTHTNTQSSTNSVKIPKTNLNVNSSSINNINNIGNNLNSTSSNANLANCISSNSINNGLIGNKRSKSPKPNISNIIHDLPTTSNLTVLNNNLSSNSLPNTVNGCNLITSNSSKSNSNLIGSTNNLAVSSGVNSSSNNNLNVVNINTNTNNNNNLLNVLNNYGNSNSSNSLRNSTMTTASAGVLSDVNENINDNVASMNQRDVISYQKDLSPNVAPKKNEKSSKFPFFKILSKS